MPTRKKQQQGGLSFGDITKLARKQVANALKSDAVNNAIKKGVDSLASKIEGEGMRRLTYGLTKMPHQGGGAATISSMGGMAPCRRTVQSMTTCKKGGLAYIKRVK